MLFKKALGELLEKVKAISTKGLINKYSILNGAKYFYSGIFENYLLFIPPKNILNILMVLLRLIRGNLMEYMKKILKIIESDSNLAPTFVDDHLLPAINFNGHCLINDISIPKRVINLYISYILRPCLRNLNSNFTLNNCLSGPAKLTKNAYLDKYKYSGYGIGFHSRS